MINKAKEYAEGKVTEALSQVVADAYMAGYNAGYQDGYNKVFKDSVTEGVEYVDLGLPSGTLWASSYAKDENGNVIFLTQAESMTYNLPTNDQWQELINECKWEQKSEKTGLLEVFTIGTIGLSVWDRMGIKSHLKRLEFMKLRIVVQEKMKYSFG